MPGGRNGTWLMLRSSIRQWRLSGVLEGESRARTTTDNNSNGSSSSSDSNNDNSSSNSDYNDNNILTTELVYYNTSVSYTHLTLPTICSV